MSKPKDLFSESYSSELAQDENNINQLNLPPTCFSAKQTTYPLYHFQEWNVLKQCAPANREVKLKVIASILLKRVDITGNPMGRRPGQGTGSLKEYVSSLGRCVAVAE